MGFSIPGLQFFDSGRITQNRIREGQEDVYSKILDNYEKKRNIAREQVLADQSFLDQQDLRSRVQIGVSGGQSPTQALQTAFLNSTNLFTQNQAAANLVGQQRLLAGSAYLQGQGGDTSLLNSLGLGGSVQNGAINPADLAAVFGLQPTVDAANNAERRRLADDVIANRELGSDVAGARSEAARNSRIANEAELARVQAENELLRERAGESPGVDPDANISPRRRGDQSSTQSDAIIQSLIPDAIPQNLSSQPQQADLFVSNQAQPQRRNNRSLDTFREDRRQSDSLFDLLRGADPFGPSAFFS